MNRSSKWGEFRGLAADRAAAGRPEDWWVAYPFPLKNARTAQTVASTMRKAMPELEIKTRMGVIWARVRPEPVREAKTA